jgi:hypothetical protein
VRIQYAHCPRCGKYTALPAERCAHCGAPFGDLPPDQQQRAMVPLPEPPPPVVPVLGELTPVKAYVSGLAIGILPLVIAALVAGGGGVFVTGWALVVVLSIVGGICTNKRPWRWLGYGLLTIACISPVIAFIGCLAIA